jgi:signal peptidase I
MKFIQREFLRMAQASRRERRRSPLVEWTITLIVVLFATTTIVEAYVIPSGSMEGTLRIGDHVLIDKLAYAKGSPAARYILPYQEVRHGDVVVFLFPLDPRHYYVKRIIGVPGDRIRIVGRAVYRNGRRLAEPYKQHILDGADPYRDNFPATPPADIPERGARMLAQHVRNGELVVPHGCYFVMGDNRDNSFDSRYWGLVPRECILGKPLLVFWSYDAATEDLTDWRLDHFKDLALNFLSKTRWERTGRIIRGFREQP